MANTKRALLTSALAIVACVAMLIGSTFAWFTDTASTGVNKIQAGNLKVDLQIFDKETGKWVTAEGKTLDFVKAEGHGNEEVLWEPGVRYALPELRIVNKGNLALKYRVVIAGAKDATPDNGIDDLKLLDVIDWTYSVSGAGGDAVASLDTERHLAAKTGDEDVYDTLKIMGTMQTTAGNDYQGMAVEGIAIKAYATQDTVESDSFNDQYDKDATYYPVLDQNGLKDALAVGGNVKVDKDVAVAPELTEEQKNEKSLAPQTTVTKDTVLDLSGKKIGVEAKEDFGKASPVLMAVMDGTLTINGDGEINCEAGNQQVYGINVNGGHVVINGGSFYGAITAVQVQKGTLTINGGFFDMAPTCKTVVPQYAKYVVNCIDAAYKNGTAKIAICGGTFVNFDPSADPEGAGTSYVADGYTVVAEEQANGDTWYTVVKDPTTYPAGKTEADFGETGKAMDAAGNTYTSFKEAMENVADGGTLYFKKDSTVDFPTHLNVTKSVTIYGNGADFSGKDISIGTYAAPENGEATVNIYNTKNLVVWGQPVGDRADVWNVNFYGCENDGYNFLMFRGGENSTAKINLTMTDCKATGFVDSIVHATADGTITIKNCTFANNCAPINIAHKQAGSMTITVEDCTFTNCGKIDTANDYFAPARFVNNSAVGTLTVSLKNNTFADTIGTNGDILLGDYRTGKASHALTATIKTKAPVMVKSSADAAYSYNGGTITLN